MLNKTLRQTLIYMSSDLEVGETCRSVCPKCNGGSGEEQSLNLTRTDDGAVLIKCHRASCDLEGMVGSRGIIADKDPTVAPTPRKREHKRWTGETAPTPEAVAEWVQREWGLAVPPTWRWTEDFGGRIAMSVRTPQNTHRGWVLRSACGRPVRTKAYTYHDEPDTPKASWYREHLSGPLVLVEDIPSAIRASQYVNAVALLGAEVTPLTATEIADHRHGGRVIVALDNDATKTAIRLARRHALLWGDVSVAVLPKDLKDMTEEELCKTIQPMLTS